MRFWFPHISSVFVTDPDFSGVLGQHLDSYAHERKEALVTSKILTETLPFWIVGGYTGRVSFMTQ